MTKSAIPLVFAAALALVSLACREQGELAKWDTALIAPVATGSVNLTDFVPDEYTDIAEDQVVHFVASDTLINLGLDTIIGIPDYSVDTSFFVPVSGVFLNPGVPFLTQVTKTTFPLQDVRLTYALVRESVINVSLKNNVNKAVLFTYEIPSATLNGDTFRIERRLEAKSTIEEDFELSGYELDLRGEEGKGYNTIITKIEVMIHPDEASGHTFAAGESVDVKSTVSSIIPQYVVGYFGNQTAEYDERQELTQFSDLPFESINITDFDITMTIDNGIGADLALNVRRLATRNSANEVIANLEHPMIGTSQMFTRAINLYDDDNPVKHIRKTISFTDENSNLDQLLEIKPNRFIADLDIRVNPLGNISRGNDFVYYGHNLSATMDLHIPLVVSVKGLHLVDTVAFAFDKPENEDPLKRLNAGVVRFIVDNAYPIDAWLQFYLMDEVNNTLDSLFVAPLLVAGAMENEAGVVEFPERSVVEVAVDQKRIDHMDLASQLRADIRLNTVGSDSVHIRANGHLDFKVIADLNVKVGKL